MEYFNSGNDDSTISSITTVEHRGFPRFASRSYNHPGAATSLMVALCSGCCCGSDTPVAYPMSTDNTLIARNSTFGTLSASNSFQSVNHSRSLVVRNGKCFGQEYLSAQSIRRPKLLGRRGWSRWQKPPTEKMSPSLFDNLSEDELDEEMNRTGCDVGAKKQKRGLPLRGVLTWKRK